ncbi:MAG: zinc-ribbon domain-containing protein [Ruminococcaceae bacterium]|nr:zinc-ribbon domain-containing protein [Oscillospiraceae bacterium]
MKYCQYCRAQLVDDAKFCSYCGKETSCQSQQSTTNGETVNRSFNQEELVNKLSSRLQTNGIIWIVVAIIQLIIGLGGYWVALIVGVLNLISAVTDIKNSKLILSNQNGIVKAYESLTNPIIALVYNIVIGGVIGVLGSIYYLIFVRGFIMENKIQFLTMETDASTEFYNTSIRSDKEIHTEILLTEQEALNGAEKEVVIVGFEQPIKVSFPKNMKDGYTLALHNVKLSKKDGQTIKKDVYIRICVKPIGE